MKRSFFFLVLIIAAAVFPTLSCAKAEPVTTTLTVEGMHCQSCADAIISALEEIEGVTTASSDFSTGTTTATYDAKVVSNNNITTTIEDLGYKIVTPPADS